MNSSQKNLVEKVVSCISSIFDKLPNENQWALVPLIREAIEEVAVEKVDDYLGENSFRRKINSIKMLEIAEGVKTLATVIQNSIELQSKINYFKDNNVSHYYGEEPLTGMNNSQGIFYVSAFRGKVMNIQCYVYLLTRRSAESIGIIK
jgi:hypothetical protein